MHFYYIALLGIFALANAVLADQPHATNADTLPIDTPTSRLLRTDNTGEERGFSLNRIPGVKKISSFMTDTKVSCGLNLIPKGKKISSVRTDKKLTKYLQSNREIDDVFSKLKLNKAGKDS
ncbi:hypothetical protein P3T76_010614 [Phytophthora citrophthora]|uniref:RxLR effector protein n=1 Tax=Phytophthora citrophthora TaxID=4793 RepID=A0AAD9GBP7_9STRA|nr:hypothetical protein P3T76_010614 [Phytophthora citrophthora]